jgi:hypothetical protein
VPPRRLSRAGPHLLITPTQPDARALKPKTLTRITPAREGSTYQLEIEDEAGKRVLFALTSDQACSWRSNWTASWPMRRRSCTPACSPTGCPDPRLQGRGVQGRGVQGRGALGR